MGNNISPVEGTLTAVAAAVYVAGANILVALVRAVTAAVILIFKEFGEAQKIEERKDDNILKRGAKKAADKFENIGEPNQKEFWWGELKRAGTEWIPLGGSIYWLYQDYKSTNDPTVKDQAKKWWHKGAEAVGVISRGAVQDISPPLRSEFLDINRCWFHFNHLD